MPRSRPPQAPSLPLAILDAVWFVEAVATAPRAAGGTSVRLRPAAAASARAPWVLAVLLLLLATSATAAERMWVELESPSDEASVTGPVPLIEVRGWTGTGLPGGHDVLIAVDRSMSVWAASGADIDEDGRVGRNRADVDLFLDFDERCTDPGDTILRAELMAARRLILRMDPSTTRMGLMSFGGGARIHAPIGSDVAELLHALGTLPDEPDLGGTSFDNALRLARLHFESLPRAEPSGARRHRSLILLSDGTPTAPAPIDVAERFAVQLARDAAEIGVRIYAFALGPEALGNPEVYRSITDVSGGDLVLIERPADVTDFVPYISLSRVERVEIDNLSSREHARAVRLFPDGSFDGFAPLREGVNILRITVHGEQGDHRFVDRRVRFTRSDGSTDAERAGAEGLLRALKVRTQETKLAEAARRRVGRGSPERTGLTIEVEPGVTGPPSP